MVNVVSFAEGRRLFRAAKEAGMLAWHPITSDQQDGQTYLVTWTDWPTQCCFAKYNKSIRTWEHVVFGNVMDIPTPTHFQPHIKSMKEK